MPQKKISIVIPTYNAGTLLHEVLDLIFRQSLAPYEVIIIDSSSSDTTPQIAKSFPVRFYRIKKKDFGHGKTRNYGAELAKGDYVVFVTQDAIPRNEYWLTELVKSLDITNVAGAFSRQIAHDNAVPMEKFFYSQMYQDKELVFNKENIYSQSILFSNASSAVRRVFLIENPFPEDILMSEDFEWALRVLRENYVIAYEANSQVNHSHDTSFRPLFKRYFDFGVSHDQIKARQSGVSFLGKGLETALKEVKYLIWSNNVQWIPRSISYNVAKFLGLTLGRSNQVLPRSLKRKFTNNYKEYWQ